MTFQPKTAVLLGVLVTTLCSCVSRQTITGPERSILGEWLVPGGEPPMARTMVSDTIDWGRFNGEEITAVIKTDSSVDQYVRFRSNGRGVLHDKTRGRVRFEYTILCDHDSAHAVYDMGLDSAGNYVELVDHPFFPCKLRTGSATYGFLCEPMSPFPDSTQISRQSLIGQVIVNEIYVWMIRLRH
jgi:hypothetical protein